MNIIQLSPEGVANSGGYIPGPPNDGFLQNTLETLFFFSFFLTIFFNFEFLMMY